MRLPPDDAKDFFRLLTSLLDFVIAPRGKRKGAGPEIGQKDLSSTDRFDLHQRFAANAPREIAAYLSANPDRLPVSDLAEIAAWKEAVTGDFVFFHQFKSHHVVLWK